ncbi:MAG: hypothetical protein KBS67_01380 [Bacteroidales bacterium]|nr:hypothetical protein [Candidatus Cryptobacteroides equifaecalis]
MYKKILTLFCILMGAGCVCQAQDIDAGLFNSPKGFGVAVRFSSMEREFSTINLFADVTGLLDGQSNSPGVKICYDYAFSYLEFGTNGRLRLYSGPGVSIGYLKDRVAEPHGFMLALNCVNGIQAFFDRGVSLDLSFTLEAGLHMRTDVLADSSRLSIYGNGFRQCFFPQLTIFKRF